jgi:hypothetical protein
MSISSFRPRTTAPFAALALFAAAHAAPAAIVASYDFEEGPPATPGIGTVIDGAGGDDNATLLDASGNATAAPGNGTTAGPVYVTGAAALAGNSSLSFDGTNDHVFLGADQDLVKGVSNVLLSARIRPNALGATSPAGYLSVINIGRGTAGATNSRALLTIGNGGRIRIGGRELDSQANPAFLESPVVLAAGNTYDISGLIDYANNQLTITVADPAGLVPTQVFTGPATGFDVASLTSSDTTNNISNIGATPAGSAEFFNGLIDNVVIETNVPVPEPAGMTLLCAAAIPLLKRRRK